MKRNGFGNGQLAAWLMVCAVLAESSTARAAETEQKNQQVEVPFFDFREIKNYENRFTDIHTAGYFAHCKRSIHPPRVEWQPVEGVARYRLILTQNRKVLGAEEARSSPHFMRAGWDKTQPERVAHVTIQGFDEAGKLVAMSRMFHIFVAPGYSRAEAAKKARPYREAALKAFEYLEGYSDGQEFTEESNGIHPVLYVAVFVNGKPVDFSFPSLHDPAYATMAENLYKIANEPLRRRIARFARSVGDHLLLCSYKDEGWVYQGLIRGCATAQGETKVVLGGDDATREKLSRLVEVAKCGNAGEALLKIYAVTKDEKYLAAAKQMAETFVRTQQKEGSWPARADARSGEVIAEYSACSGAVASFLDRLNDVSPDPRWVAARDGAERWMAENPMKTYAWVTNFDDVTVGASNANPFAAALSNFDLYPYMRYLCQRAEKNLAKDVAQSVREQLEWSDNHFVFYGPDPLFPYDPFYPVAAEQGDPEILDKINGCWMPMDGHTANLGLAMLALNKITKDPRWREIAEAAGSAITQYQLHDGQVMTWLVDQTTGLSSYYGIPWSTFSFWPAGTALSGALWAELAALE